MNPALYCCMDCGNSRLKWGVWLDDGSNEGVWLQRGVLNYTDLRDNHAALYSTLVKATDAHVPHRIVIANVAGKAVEKAVNKSLYEWRQRILYLQHSSGGGIINEYRHPDQLGIDRWCSLVGAAQLFSQQTLLVVNAGTAATVDALSADGRFIGGYILPGLCMMRNTLAVQTADLTLTEGEYEKWPRSTENAIYSGAMQAIIGTVKQAAQDLREADGHMPLCLLSGGAALQILSALRASLDVTEYGVQVQHIEQLCLQGVLKLGRELA